MVDSTTKRPVKWILIGDRIRMSHALYHRHLLERNETTCDGGGVVDVDYNNQRVIFSGSSDDFGKANKNQFMKAVGKNRDEIDRDLFFCFYIDTEGFDIVFM